MLIYQKKDRLQWNHLQETIKLYAVNALCEFVLYTDQEIEVRGEIKGWRLMLKVNHIVNSVFTSRTYILLQEGSSFVWLVDCGDVPPLMDVLSSMGADLSIIKGVLLTHVHYDHIYGLPKLKEMFPSLRVYTNEYGKKALTDSRLNFSKYHNDPIVYESENVVTCDEGSEIELFDGVQAKVYYTPGHNPSCLTYEIGDYLFTGDAYIPGTNVVTTLKGGDKALAVESLNKILRLAEGKHLCPGHEVKGEISND